MEAKWWLAGAVAPVLWGSCYWVVGGALTDVSPLWGAAARALPAGVVLLAIRPTAMSRRWWLRAGAVGMLTNGGFFALVFVSAQRLPSSSAATITGASPLLFLLLAWGLMGQRPSRLETVLACFGLLGVTLLVGGAHGGLDPVGVLAAGLGVGAFASGTVLSNRWCRAARRAGEAVPPTVALLAAQLLVSGAVVALVAAALDGAPPVPDPVGTAALTYVSVVATAVAFLTWVHAVPRMGVTRAGRVGLLNPVTGVLTGVLLAHESLSSEQLAGLTITMLSVVVGKRVRPTDPDPDPAGVTHEGLAVSTVLSHPARMRSRSTVS